jgi:hypothetical protein
MMADGIGKAEARVKGGWMEVEGSIPIDGKSDEWRHDYCCVMDKSSACQIELRSRS